ncbi:MAG: hypothetical protein ACE5KG_03305 [Nitrososphaerales archaeon]
METERAKPSGEETDEIDESARLRKATSKVRSWQKWGIYFIIFGFVTAFITWERIFGFILGVPPELIEPNIFWIATGIIEILVGFTLRILGAQYERRISGGEIPRIVS